MKSFPRPDDRRAISLLIAAGAMFTIAGGYVHLREWLEAYRHIPSAVPGSFVVREGFIVNVVMSVVASVALVATLIKRSKATPYVIAGAFAFQAGSLVTLLVSRTSSVFGWSERGWTLGASQTRAVEIGALLVLGLALVLDTARRHRLNRSVLRAAPSA